MRGNFQLSKLDANQYNNRILLNIKLYMFRASHEYNIYHMLLWIHSSRQL